MTGRIGCEGTATKSCCRSSVHFLAYRYMIRWNLHKYKVFQGPSQVQLTSSPLGSADRVRTVSRPNMPTRAACHAFRLADAHHDAQEHAYMLGNCLQWLDTTNVCDMHHLLQSCAEPQE
eukprot:scaffold86538_cov17-Tisochrysis_lutea.AAC.1